MIQDNTAGAAWLRRAADQGHSQAQFNLAVMYVNGLGVAADNVEAASWYRRAAEQGNTSAQYNLGLMYYNGDGVAQDNVMAHVWTSIAAANGHENAATARDAILERMSISDVYEARDIALTCINQNFRGCSR